MNGIERRKEKIIQIGSSKLKIADVIEKDCTS